MYQCLAYFLIYSVVIWIKIVQPLPPKNLMNPNFENFPGPLLHIPLLLTIGADAMVA